MIIGVRGYYRDTKGQPGTNDRGIYDDACFVVTEDSFHAFNFNTDPSRSGINRNVGKGMAVLQPGTYWYRVGIHGLSRPKAQQYKALVQAGRVKIIRDGSIAPEEGFFGINIHRGGVNGTSSEGCQTSPPGQWAEFIRIVEQIAGSGTIRYLLVEGTV